MVHAFGSSLLDVAAHFVVKRTNCQKQLHKERLTPVDFIFIVEMIFIEIHIYTFPTLPETLKHTIKFIQNISIKKMNKLIHV